MASSGVTITGQDAILRKLKQFGDQAQTMIADITQVTATDIAREAAQNAPVDMGKLRQSINATMSTPTFYYVYVNEVPIGAYVEFGTGTLVDVPDEWKGLAWQFYVNGKGHLPPRPYLYPAFVRGREQYLRDLQDLLSRMAGSFNS